MKNPKVVFLDAYTTTIDNLSLEPINALGDVTYYDRTKKSKIIERSRDADIIITNKVPIGKEEMEALPNLKYICVAATGYNNIDIEAAKSKNILVSNVVGYSTEGVVQTVFSHALNALTHIAYYDGEVADGRWSESPDFSFYDHSIRELAGKTMGIFGFGNIGQRVGEVARAFGMEVIATHNHPERDNRSYVTFVGFDELAEQSDILSIHASFKSENQGLFNREVFAKMKNSSILINTARGAFIDENDLSQALNNDLINYACLDVLNNEPPKLNNPLFTTKNCIISPHIAWASEESRTRLVSGIAKNIRSFLDGSIINQVTD